MPEQTGAALPPRAGRDRTYDAVRAAGGVLELPVGAWLVADYGPARAVLRDSASFSSEVVTDGDSVLLGHDDAAHQAAVRRPLAAAFSAQALGGREAWIRDVARETLRAMADRGETDLDAGFAGPVTSRLLAALLGLGDRTDAELEAWFPHLGRYTRDGATAAGPADASFREAAAELFGAVGRGEARDVLAALQGIPRFAEDRRRLERNLGQLFWAGVATARATLVSAVRLLLRDPALEAEVRADRSLLPGFLSEVLRLRPAHKIMPRRAREGARIEGHAVPAGAMVYVLVEPANTDPAVFEDPGAVRLGRAARHLSFGYGPHYCPGHFWASEELVGALDVALDAWPSLRDAFAPDGPSEGSAETGPLVTRVPPRP